MCPGEEISGSEASGSEELDDGDEEGGEAGEGRRRRRGREELSHSVTSPSRTCSLGCTMKGTGVMCECVNGGRYRNGGKSISLRNITDKVPARSYGWTRPYLGQ